MTGADLRGHELAPEELAQRKRIADRAALLRHVDSILRPPAWVYEEMEDAIRHALANNLTAEHRSAAAMADATSPPSWWRAGSSTSCSRSTLESRETRVIATTDRATVMRVGERPDSARRQNSFSEMERVTREDRKQRYRATTPAQRVESALHLSELAVELKTGRRTRSE